MVGFYCISNQGNWRTKFQKNTFLCKYFFAHTKTAAGVVLVRRSFSLSSSFKSFFLVKAGFSQAKNTFWFQNFFLWKQALIELKSLTLNLINVVGFGRKSWIKYIITKTSLKFNPLFVRQNNGSKFCYFVRAPNLLALASQLPSVPWNNEKAVADRARYFLYKTTRSSSGSL